VARLLTIVMLLLSSSVSHTYDEGTAVSPSPEGDTRMGADAANSGTNVSDKELQAEEEKGTINDEQDGLKQEDLFEVDESYLDVK